MSKKKQKRRKLQTGRLPGETLAESILRKKRTQEAYIQAAQDQVLDAKSEVRTQRALWLACIAMHEAFGVGHKRFLRWAEELQKATDWYTEMRTDVDEDYANEMLRRKASRCSGIEVQPLFDEEMLERVLAQNEKEATAAEA